MWLARVCTVINCAIVIGIASLTTGAVAARPLGDQICSAAAAYLAKSQMPIQDGMLLVSARGSATWSPAAIESRFSLPAQSSEAYLAYFMSRSYSATGAVSAKISLEIVKAENDKTNYVDVYRPAIDPGTNSCERRGRASIQRRVRVNEYMDYHDPSVGMLSSTLEDFHFKYPQDDGRCARTNNPSHINAFQFEGVRRTQGDTFIARTFSIVGTAFAIDHNFSVLRSELHYRANVDSAGTCVGFVVPLGASPQASFVINEHGFGGFPSSKRWFIGR
jgi:hypothetical protein